MSKISKDQVISDARDAAVEMSGDSSPVTYSGDTGLAARIRSIQGGGGGNNDFVVTYTMDMDEGTVTANKTYTEILTAIDTGKSVSAILTSGQTGEDNFNAYTHLAFEGYDSSQVAANDIQFWFVYYVSEMKGFWIKHLADNTVNVIMM